MQKDSLANASAFCALSVCKISFWQLFASYHLARAIVPTSLHHFGYVLINILESACSSLRSVLCLHAKHHFGDGTCIVFLGSASSSRLWFLCLFAKHHVGDGNYNVSVMERAYEVSFWSLQFLCFRFSVCCETSFW